MMKKTGHGNGIQRARADRLGAPGARQDRCLSPVSSSPQVCTNLEGHPRGSEPSPRADCDEASPGPRYLPGGVPRGAPAPHPACSGKAGLCRARRAAAGVRRSVCPDTGTILRWPLQTESGRRCTPAHRRGESNGRITAEAAR